MYSFELGAWRKNLPSKLKAPVTYGIKHIYTVTQE